jgi:hypothetical protein
VTPEQAKVWLTYDEAVQVMNGLVGDNRAAMLSIALLDERVGEVRPTSIRTMMFEQENPPLKDTP